MTAPIGRIFALLVAMRGAAASAPRLSRAVSAIRGRSRVNRRSAEVDEAAA